MPTPRTRSAPTTPDLAARVRAAVEATGLAGRHGLVGVSGGPDSLALFELLADLRDAGILTLSVAHVAHGISEAAAVGADRARARAAARGVPFHEVRLRLGADCSETRAREARLAALHRLRRATGADAILLGHHAADQAETVLLRALRGSGPRGLAGMAPRRGRLVRPLLEVAPAALRADLERRGVAWWDDPANADSRHDRSWLRGEVLPLVRRRWPETDAALGRTARLAADDATAWQLAVAAMPDLALGPAPDGAPSIDADALARYDARLGSALLRGFAAAQGLPLGPVRARRILAWLATRTEGGWQPVAGRWRVVVQQGRLRFARAPRARPWPGALLRPGEAAADAGRFVLTCTDSDAEAVQADRHGLVQDFAAGELVLRPAAPGDRIVPFGGRGHRRVVRCLQDAGVPGWERDGWPVLADGDTVLWIVGICRGAGAVPAPGTRRLRVTAERR